MGAWGKQMTLFEAVEGLNSLDDDSTIYAAEPWTETSHAITLSEPDERVRAQQAAKFGLRYFLEVSIALGVPRRMGDESRSAAESPRKVCEANQIRDQ
jgi:hypothetical protein